MSSPPAPAPQNVLIIYYSLNSQTQLAVDIMREELAAQGHSVEAVRITPVKDFRAPMPFFSFLRLLIKTYTGMDLTTELKVIPTAEQIGKADLIIFGYQPWFLTPSVPVNSFLDGPNSAPLKGRQVVSLITCRQLWRRSYRIFERKIRALGGEVIQSLVYEDPARPPGNMISTVLYIITGIDIGKSGPLRRWFLPFGLAPEAIRDIRLAANELAARLTAGTLKGAPIAARGVAD